MLFDDLEEILDDISDICEYVIHESFVFGLLITSPIWYIPYSIYKAFKNKEDRENE